MAVITKKLHADYDSVADVLYFVHGPSLPGFGDEGEDDVILRYALSDNLPIGASIIGYMGCSWETKKDRLASIIAKHLSLPQLAVSDVLTSIGL